jgi:hypothetical protein
LLARISLFFVKICQSAGTICEDNVLEGIYSSEQCLHSVPAQGHVEEYKLY